MPVTNTQEEYKIRSISPVRINPSILEGSFLYSSIYGPDKAFELVRFPPEFLFAPVVSGDIAIPGTLVCTPGTVSSAPLALRGYQWYSDGVAVPGATSNVFNTDESYDGKTLTCEVTATNPLGVDVSMSNGVTVTLIEPIWVNALSYYTVVGFGAKDNITVSDIGLMAVTGLPIQDALSVMEFDLYGIIFPTLHSSLLVPEADLGLGGWTSITGSFTTRTTSANTGSAVYTCSTGTGGSANYDFPLAAPLHSIIDDKNLLASLDFFTTSLGGSSGTRGDMRIYVDAIDGTTSAVTNILDGEQIKPPSKGTNTWYYFTTLTKPIPANTRTLRVRVVILNNSSNNVEIDDIAVRLFTAY